MKSIIVFCIQFTLIFQAFAQEVKPIQASAEMVKILNATSLIDPVAILNADKNQMQNFIESHFNSIQDKKRLSQIFKNLKITPETFKVSKSKNGNLNIEFSGSLMKISDINPSQKTFKLNGEIVSLSRVYSLTQLEAKFKRIQSPIIPQTSFNITDIILPKAHALAPLVLGLIAFAIAGVAILGISYGQQALSIEQYESDLRGVEGICDGPSGPFNQYSQRYETSIRRFEQTARRLYNMSPSDSRQSARRLLGTDNRCEEIKESWSAWAASWAYSILNWTNEDRRDKVYDLCVRARRVERCIADYQDHQAQVNGSSRNINENSAPRNRRQGRNSSRARGN